MKLILCDLNTDVYNSFRKYFAHLPNVEIYNQPFQTIDEYDCIVSPANSFGLMDGGFDLHIIRHFGTQLMERVQQYIINNYAGEQPVGTSFIIETGNDKHRFLVHTPTMRVPRLIVGTDNVYYAMKSMLLAIIQHNKSNNEKINSVLTSGLGALTGGLSPEVVAKQMYLAYEHVIMNPITNISWNVAINRDNVINSVKI